MRVAIDARKLHDFGIGTYIRNLLRQLARIDHDTEYVLLCGEADLGVAAQLGPNFRAVLEPSPNYSHPRANPRAVGAAPRAAGSSTTRPTTCCRPRSAAPRS